MAHEFGANFGPTTNQWLGVYHLILRMMKAGYWLRASSDGVTKVVSDDPTAHAGNTGTGFAPTSTGNTGGSATIGSVVDHPYGKLVTVGGLSSLVSPTVQSGNSEGNYLTLSGAAQGVLNGTHQIYQVDSYTQCKILVRTNSAIGADANSGSITFTEKGLLVPPVAPDYGSLGGRQWWALLEGMETYQLDFTTSPGSFLRGERVTQAVSGAEGEVLGVVWDPLTSKGWAIVMPWIGVFTTGQTVTGATSAATFTPTAIRKFRRQWVFSKGSAGDNTTGSLWYACFRDDGGSEVAEAYHTKASNANCTATVAPGGSPTVGNRQFSSTVAACRYVVRCQNNDTQNGTALVHADGILYQASGGPDGRIHVAAANVMPRAGRSADGTWWAIHHNSAVTGFHMLGCFRVDATEDGEPELLTHVADTSATTSPDARSGRAFGASRFGTSHCLLNDLSRYQWLSVRRRAYGVPAGGPYFTPNSTDGYTGATMLGVTNPTWGWNPMGGTWGGATLRMVSHPAATPPAFKEPLAVRNGTGGRLRWFYLIQQGNITNTAESRKYVVIHPYSANIPGLMIGPWDGTTDPLTA